MNEFLSELGRRAPQIALAMLAANRGGPMALGAFQGGLAQAQQRQEALARQAQLDEERRQAQAVQQAHLERADTRADEQADFARKQALVNALAQYDADPSALAGLYGVPQEQVTALAPTFSSAKDKRKAREMVERAHKSPQFQGYFQSEEGIAQLDEVTLPWKEGTIKFKELRAIAEEPNIPPKLAQPKQAEPKLETRSLDVQAAEALAKGDTATYERLLKVKKEMGQADDRPPRGMTEGGGLSPGMESNVLNRLTTQWTTAVKPAVELSRQVKMMDAGLAAAERGDLAQGAQAVLVTFQKILDPASVVRESEFMRSAAGQSLINRVQGAYERLTQGGAGVPLPELKKFAQLAREAAKAQAGGYTDAVKARIGRTADRYKIPREIVFEDYDFGAALDGAAADDGGGWTDVGGGVRIREKR
jgi:hypothetical protein